MQDRRIIYSFDEFDQPTPLAVHASLAAIEELEPITAPQSTASFLEGAAA
jgi:hypothetical protein